MPLSFERMIQRAGGYALPYLITIGDYDDTVLYRFVNNTANVVYDGNTYNATTFEYLPNSESQGFDGGGTLSIPVVGTYLIDMIETYRRIKLSVVGVLVEGGTVTPVKTFRHSYGAVTWDRGVARFTFEKDARLMMTFPANVFSHYNNRGN